jgi:hypothetical protein
VHDLFAGVRPLYVFTCEHCGRSATSKRPEAKFCSEPCRNRRHRSQPLSRKCGNCGSRIKAEGNRRYCSRTCSKIARRQQDAAWRLKHPDAQSMYNARRAARRPNEERTRKGAERGEVIAALGGKCEACGIDNPIWLEIDYRPTTRGKRFRHSRGRKFIMSHLSDFRLLCANHHRELTLTGRVAGTSITQPMAPLARAAE